jgi:hypothetical protein
VLPPTGLDPIFGSQRPFSAYQGRWAGYLVDQGERHFIAPKINGKVIGLSRSIHYAAVEAQREALEAWRRQAGNPPLGRAANRAARRLRCRGRGAWVCLSRLVGTY